MDKLDFMIMVQNKPLPKKFYQSYEILQISKNLLGKILFTRSDNSQITGGIISEVEAYKGPFDKASHAYNGKRTPKNECMYLEGGYTYIFKCYGIHTLFNIVTHTKDSPHAILVRSVIPYYGIETMKKRRNGKRNISSGPGVVSQCLGIQMKDNGISLQKNRIWVEDHGVIIPEHAIVTAPRIGISYAKEHAKLPWRYFISSSYKI